MKSFLIDLKEELKSNQTKLYWALIIIFGLSIFSLVAYSSMKPVEMKHESIKQGEQLLLNGEKLTYLKSFYDEEKKEMVTLIGVNSVQTLFNSTNLKAKVLYQTKMKWNEKVLLKKETPQILSVRIKNVPDDYVLARLSITYKEEGTDTTDTADLYIKAENEKPISLDKNFFKNESIEFKKSFIEKEITALEQKIQEQIDKQEKLKADIKSLNSDTTLMTESEKKQLKATEETLDKQFMNAEEKKKELAGELLEREKQRVEIEKLEQK